MTTASLLGLFLDIIKNQKMLYLQAIIISGVVNIFLIIATFYVVSVFDRAQGHTTVWLLIIIFMIDGPLRILGDYCVDHIGNKKKIQSSQELLSLSTLSVLAELPYTFLFVFVIGLMGGDLVVIPIVAIVAILINGFTENRNYIMSNSIRNICFPLTIMLGLYLINAGNLTVGGLIGCTILIPCSLVPVSRLSGLVSRQRGRMGSGY